MNARQLLLVTTLIATTATPALSFADDAATMNACVKAFLSTYLPQASKVRVQIDAPATSRMAPRSRTHEIALTARGMQSGREIAKATCVVDADGSITALNNTVTPTLVAARTTRLDR